MSNQELAFKIATLFFDALKVLVVPIVICIICYWFKDEIKGLFKSIKTIKVNAVGQSIEASADQSVSLDTDSAYDSSVLANSQFSEKKSLEESEEDWVQLVEVELEKGDLQAADVVFQSHLETDISDKDKKLDKALYYLLLIKLINSSKAVEQLERLIKDEENDEMKYDLASFYDDGLRISKQYPKIISFYTELLDGIKDSLITTKITTIIADLYVIEDNWPLAEARVKKRLSEVKNNLEKGMLYISLSAIEKHKGNMKLSILLLDKSLEFNPSNENALFKSAFRASDDGLKFISISNYDLLKNINPNHEHALNNLAVSADHEGLKYISCKFYEKAMEKKSSIAMSNLGYKYSSVGLLDKAETLANESLKQDDPHPNADELLKDINTSRTQEKEKWEGILKTSSFLQRLARKYVDKHYIPIDEEVLSGSWITSDAYPVTMHFNCQSKEATIKWSYLKSSFDSTIIECKITGKFHNSSFEGHFSERKADGSSSFTYDSLKDFDCLGYIGDNNNELTIFNLAPSNDFTFTLKKTVTEQ